MASVVTAASAFVAAAVPPIVKPPVAQHEGALKTKQNRLVNITLGFRVPILGNSDSKQYFEAKLTWLFAREPRQTIYQMKLHASNNLVLTSPFRYFVRYIR